MTSKEAITENQVNPILHNEEFLADAPLCIIDTSRQTELWKHASSVDIRVEYELS